MPHFSRWRLLALVVGLAAACTPATPTAAPTNTAPAASTAAASATAASTAAAALRPGDAAPDFSLPDSTGALVNLASVVADHRSTVLIFYLSHT